MARFSKLLFGTAGLPLSTPRRNTENGIRHLTELGLDGMELEFVHSVNIRPEKAPLIDAVRKEEGKTLTCHGQYYINLNSLEPAKVEASKQRILNAARIAHLAGAFSLVFHAAFYQKVEPKKVYANVKAGLKDIVATLQEEGNPIWVRPETTGKPTQFSGAEDLLRLSQEIEQVMPCIDFAHLHARTNGKVNTYEEFSRVLTQVEEALGREGLDQMHIHVSGINYGEKGEKNHLILEESDFRYRELLRALRDFKAKGMVICESPNIEEDALLLQKTYQQLG
ncbi:MAG: TIM barrel protein [DPANN group archaeon]|nr:TIM barrel protein [DPANN group archaeon]